MGHPPSVYSAFEGSVPVLFQSVIAAMLIVLLIAWRVRAGLGSEAAIPDAKVSLRNVFEILFEGIASLARDSIGHDWRSYMPLLATLGTFILIGNLMGLVPGLGGPTTYIETNLAWAIVSVVTAEVASIRAHGIGGWLKHMAPGPIWMAPLMLPIELFSHVIRFLSLTIRLTANMFADHTLAAIFISSFGLAISILVPWVVLALGLFICLVQAFVFTFLTIVYIGMGVEEAH